MEQTKSGQSSSIHGQKDHPAHGADNIKQSEQKGGSQQKEGNFGSGAASEQSSKLTE